MERNLLKEIRKLASEHPRFRKQLVPLLRKTAAADKVPVFGRFERTLRNQDIEKMFLESYPNAVPGSLRIEKNQGYAKAEPGRIYGHVNVRMKTTGGEDLSGALILEMFPTLSSIRVCAFVNIDG